MEDMSYDVDSVVFAIFNSVQSDFVPFLVHMVTLLGLILFGQVFMVLGGMKFEKSSSPGFQPHSITLRVVFSGVPFKVVSSGLMSFVQVTSFPGSE